MSVGLNALLWFGAILALIPLALWLLRRSPLGAGLAGGSHTAGPGLPRPVAVLPLSPQHKVVTLEVGQGDDRLWLVLGVGPQGLQTLHTMQPGARPQGAASAPPKAAFAQLLDRLRSAARGTDEGLHGPNRDARDARSRRDRPDDKGSEGGGWTAL